MNTKLTMIRKVGRFKNKATGQTVNLHRGKKKGTGFDLTFYLYRGHRVLVPDGDISTTWEKVEA
jgi:hypothetical protein